MHCLNHAFKGLLTEKIYRLKYFNTDKLKFYFDVENQIKGIDLKKCQ